MEERLRRLEQRHVGLDGRMKAIERQVGGLDGEIAALRQERRSDYRAIKGDLELIRGELSTWAGARRALVWLFGSLTTVAGLALTLWAVLGR